MSKASFYDNVLEQPEVIERLARAYSQELADRLQEASILIQSKPVVFTGMGSSLYAGQLAANLLAADNRKAWVEDASELLHYRMGLLGPDVVLVGVSQSGESIETRKVAEQRPKETRLIAICNNENSSLAQAADIVLPILAGEEVGTSSKTYVATLAVLKAFASLSIDGAYTVAQDLQHLARVMTGVAEAVKEQAAAAVEFFAGRQLSSLFYIGRGPGAVSALQSALITKEMTGVHAEGLTAGMFRHGPLELAGEGLNAVIFAPAGPCQALMINLARELVDYGARVWLIADNDGIEVEVNSGRLLLTRLPSVAEEDSALLNIIPVELFAAELAKVKGRKPGELQQISKVTTRE